MLTSFRLFYFDALGAATRRRSDWFSNKSALLLLKLWSSDQIDVDPKTGLQAFECLPGVDHFIQMIRTRHEKIDRIWMLNGGHGQPVYLGLEVDDGLNGRTHPLRRHWYRQSHDEHPQEQHF